MATPPRSNFYDVVEDISSSASATFGKPISNNITVTVYVAPPYAAAAQTTLAQVFSAETGATTPGNPFTLPLTGFGQGEINIWLGAGSFDIKVSDSSSPKRFADRVVRWDSDPGDKGTTNAMLDDTTLAAQLGVNNPNTPTVRRGSIIIPGSENVTATTYSLMPTPDRVQNIKLETNGIIWVLYSAEVISSVAGGKVGLFFGNNQVQSKNNSGLANLEVAVGISNQMVLVSSGGAGVGGITTTPVNIATADVTTGQIIGSQGNVTGGAVGFYAAAGVYDISVRYLHSGGTITAKNRKLWVKTESYS